MALDYALGLMTRACEMLAQGDDPQRVRLQRAWTEHVQFIWEKRCLPAELAARFRELWETYTQASDDPRTTILRSMSDEEGARAARAIIAFALDVAIAHGQDAEPATPSP